jgi:hypothetical protein
MVKDATSLGWKNSIIGLLPLIEAVGMLYHSVELPDIEFNIRVPEPQSPDWAA